MDVKCYTFNCNGKSIQKTDNICALIRENLSLREQCVIIVSLQECPVLDLGQSPRAIQETVDQKTRKSYRLEQFYTNGKISSIGLLVLFPLEWWPSNQIKSLQRVAGTKTCKVDQVKKLSFGSFLTEDAKGAVAATLCYNDQYLRVIAAHLSADKNNFDGHEKRINQLEQVATTMTVHDRHDKKETAHKMDTILLGDLNFRRSNGRDQLQSLLQEKRTWLIGWHEPTRNDKEAGTQAPATFKYKPNTCNNGKPTVDPAREPANTDRILFFTDGCKSTNCSTWEITNYEASFTCGRSDHLPVSCIMKTKPATKNCQEICRQLNQQHKTNPYTLAGVNHQT